MLYVQVLTKGEREKMQLEAQIGALKAQAVSMKSASIVPAGENLASCLDADQLLDALLSLLQQNAHVEGTAKGRQSEENNSPEPSDGKSVHEGSDSLDATISCRRTLPLSAQPGFADKLALLVSVCSPLPNPTTTSTSGATATPTSSTACSKMLVYRMHCKKNDNSCCEPSSLK